MALRAWFFLVWDEAHFDSDQAIVGLMAKHITEGRAWPLFFYGQEYMLAVEACVMAPVFLLLGPSVFALHLTMVTLNLAAGLLLCYLLVRDGRLSPGLAFVATLPFWVAPVILYAGTQPLHPPIRAPRPAPADRAGRADAAGLASGPAQGRGLAGARAPGGCWRVRQRWTMRA